jgi:hypothetical protein
VWVEPEESCWSGETRAVSIGAATAAVVEMLELPSEARIVGGIDTPGRQRETSAARRRQIWRRPFAMA